MGVFSEIKPKNHARKNPFDLSAYDSYNTKVGMVLPLRFWPTLPSSEYELDIKTLLRTQPLATAAFAGFSINYDVVWTPYNDHYSSFNQFIAQRLNKQHVTQPDINYIPAFELTNFLKFIFYGALYDYLSSETTAVDHAWEESYGLVNWPLPYFLAYSRNLPEESMFLSAIRVLDFLGYRNILPLVKTAASMIKNWLDTCTYTVAEQKKLPYYIRYAALCFGRIDIATKTVSDLTEVGLDVNSDDFIKKTVTDNVDSSLVVGGFSIHNILLGTEAKDLWSVMCYNKAFWQFYRNEYYDIDFEYYLFYSGQPDVNSMPYVKLFNFDDYSGYDEHSYYTWDDEYTRLLCMFAVKPHQYKKDLFTGLLPSTQYGGVSAAATSPEWFQMFYKDSASVPSGDVVGRSNDASTPALYPINQYGSRLTNNSDNKYNSAKFKINPQLTIDVLEMRRADALQRFRERMLRAGNKTKDIFEAHGWEQPYSEKAFDVQFLGNFDGRLDLNVVSSTSESVGVDGSEVNLGQLAANGVGVVNGNKVHFQCHDFGCLMVLAYITKDAIYDAYGSDKCHDLLEPFDFPYPELQNVSLAPVVTGQLTYGLLLNRVLGYLPQNMAYKTAVDKVHGEFYSAKPWQLGGQNDYMVQGIFSNMVTPRLDTQNASSLAFFYVQPSCADNIFKVNANSKQETDQFFGNIRFDLKAVQPLDVIGLPI